jgi:hypothetical protein
LGELGSISGPYGSLPKGLLAGMRVIGTLDAEPDSPYLKADYDPDEGREERAVSVSIAKGLLLDFATSASLSMSPMAATAGGTVIPRTTRG